MSVKSLPATLPENPLSVLQDWLQYATQNEVQRNPNAMSLATVGENAQATARIVLCKELVADPGFAVFYTNYKSRKANEIAANPRVGLLFHWDSLGLQARIDGVAVRCPDEESDEYFASRDWRSQLGAWGSDQSQPLKSRLALLNQVRERALKLGFALAPDLASLAKGKLRAIPRPPHWGGYRVWATEVELWVEGTSRVHDRARWTRTIVRESENTFVCQAWASTRLQP